MKNVIALQQARATVGAWGAKAAGGADHRWDCGDDQGGADRRRNQETMSGLSWHWATLC